MPVNDIDFLNLLSIIARVTKRRYLETLEFTSPSGCAIFPNQLGVFMEEFVAYIVKNLVSDPSAVEIRSVTEDETIKLEIRVAPDDVGKVIGRRGNTIHALRTIVRRISSRVKKKVELDLIQPDSPCSSEESDSTDLREEQHCHHQCACSSARGYEEEE